MSDFSFEEAVGTPAGKAPAGDGGFTFEEAGGKAEPRSEANIRLGGVAAGGKAVARTAADFGDMMLSIPGMVMGTAADAASRVQSIFEGNDPKTAGRISKEVREGVTSTFSPPVLRGLLEKAIQAASPDDEEASPTSVAHGMETISKGIENGGKWVEKRTNGIISAETFDSLMNEGMALGGLKGMAVGTGGVGKALAERVKGDKPKAPEASYNPPEAAIDPVSRAKQDIERTTGIAEQEERASFRKQRMKEAASAFKDDTKFTAYAREHTAAEAEAFAASLPKIDPDMAGKADPELLAAVGLGATGVALAMKYPDDTATAGMGLIGLGIGGKEIRPGESLAGILAKGHNTLATLERLPGNRTEFPKTMIEEQLRRQDVTKAEREVIEGVLKGHEGDVISAADLAKGVRLATGDFELKEKKTPQFAGYGLDSIERGEFDLDPLEFRDEQEMRESIDDHPVRTSLWTLPDNLDLGFANHFNEKNYFGHTRSFDEEGVRHVVEIQSDLAQKVKQRLTEEEYDALVEEEHKWGQLETDVQSALNQLQDSFPPKEWINTARKFAEKAFSSRPEWREKYEHVLTKALDGVDKADPESARQARDFLKDMRDEAMLKVREARTKERAHLETPPDIIRISPALKNWDRRLVREELAAAARRGEATVRFASADTVAKVEGWPGFNPHKVTQTAIADANARIRSFQKEIETAKKELAAGDASAQGTINAYEGYLERAKEELKLAEERLSTASNRTEYSPEHQGIYDRYAKDITKFLKNLGGKEVTDSHGHTWIETPTTPKGGTGKRAQMFGGATLDTMKGIAAVSLGLAVGTALDKDNPIEGAILGVMGGVALSSGVVPKAFRSLRDLAKADERVRINNLTNAHEYQIAAAARDIWQVQQRIIELVPKQADREAIHRAIDAGRTGELKGKQAEAARIAQEFYEKIGAAAQDANVLKETRDDYTTHLWKLADKQKLNDLLSKKAGTPFSPSSRFAQGRLHVTLEEGKAAGLRPLTEDIAEVIGLYGNSLSRSIANRKLLDSLKVAKGPEGRLALPGKVAPASFVQIDTPSMGGWKVHPDIAPSLKFVMEAKDPGAIVNGLLALNTALKRNVVSFSLFHAKALFDAALGALNNPGTATKVVAQAIAPKVFGKNRYLQQLRDAGAGDLVDHALKSGLKFSYERGTPAVEDVGGGFYEGMKSLQAAMDKTIPYSGKATVGAYTRVNHAFDNFMWGRLHSAMKLETFAAKVEALMENSAKAGKPLTKEAAGEIAARYTNDVFGGLNWRRMAEGAKTKWGRDLSLAMLSPKGRMGLQLLMFAPDWTLSTSRAFVKAFGKGSGLKGIVSATAEADLYRQQLLRSAFYYVAIGDTVNYANSGHHLWDNKDPFRVDLGDGRTMQLSKHFTEPFEWMPRTTKDGNISFDRTRQTAINKMGQLPKEGIEQLMKVERLQATGKMQPMQNPSRHALGNVVPFAAQPAVQGEPNAGQRAVASTLGTPIYGHTPEERRQIRFQQAQARYKKHMADLEKMSGGKQ